MAEDRLLVVDDEPDFVRHVRRVAEGLGYEVVAAGNGIEFRRMFPRFDPTLVMIDIVMPDADGIDAINWLAEQKRETAIILASGFDQRYLKAAHEIATLKGLDVVATLVKPVDVAALRSILASCRAETRKQA